MNEELLHDKMITDCKELHPCLMQAIDQGGEARGTERRFAEAKIEGWYEQFNRVFDNYSGAVKNLGRGTKTRNLNEAT